MVSPASASCSQYSSAGSRCPHQTRAWPALWMRSTNAYPDATLIPGIVRASESATWSKVLWSSLRTITRQLSPSPEPGPPVRGSSIVSVIEGSGYPPGLGEIPVQAEEELIQRSGLEDGVRSHAGLLVDALRVGLDEAVDVVLGGQPGLLVQAVADQVALGAGVVHLAEVRQPEALGLPARDRVNQALPGLDVDVGRRRRGERVGVGRDADAGHVADEGHAARRVEVADVVGGVAGRVLDPEGALHLGLAALEHPQVALRDRDDLAP